jgi:hypothetical protein
LSPALYLALAPSQDELVIRLVSPTVQVVQVASLCFYVTKRL